MSQSIRRSSVHTDGSVGAVTPKGKIGAACAERCLLGVEKMLLQGFPVHSLSFPSGYTDGDVSSLAGNAMLVKAIGFAMVFATSVVSDGAAPRI